MKRGEGDLRRLSNDFNPMTRELEHQRSALVESQRPARRTPPLHGGGAVGRVGRRHRPRQPGPHHAAKPLGRAAARRCEAELVGQPLADVVPEFGQHARARRSSRPKPRAQAQITLIVGDEERTFAVRVTREQAGRGRRGSVVTFDDITELVSAQRTSAWARRRAPHRPRDQEPADADPTVGRAPAAQIRQGHHRGPRDLRQADRHDRAPGRRHQDAWSTSSPSSRACPSL